MIGRAERLFERGERKRTAYRFIEAVPLFIEAKRLSVLDKGLKSECCFSLGDVYRMVGEFKKASACYREAHRLSLVLDDEVRAVDALVGLGLSLRAVGEYKEAVALFNGCLKSYRSRGDRAGEAFTLWARAGAYRFRGDVKKAMEGFREAMRLFVKDQGGRAYCLTGLGGSSRVLGLHADSIKYYRAANRAFKKLKDTFGLAYSYCGIANAMRMRGDFQGSLRYFRLARDNYKKIGDRVSYAYTLWGEGSALQMLGRDRAALKDFDLALALFRETGDRRGAVYCMLTTGQLEFKKSAHKGVRTLKRALSMARALGLKVEGAHAKRLITTAGQAPGKLPVNLP